MGTTVLSSDSRCCRVCFILKHALYSECKATALTSPLRLGKTAASKFKQAFPLPRSRCRFCSLHRPGRWPTSLQQDDELLVEFALKSECSCGYLPRKSTQAASRLQREATVLQLSSSA